MKGLRFGNERVSFPFFVLHYSKERLLCDAQDSLFQWKTNNDIIRF